MGLSQLVPMTTFWACNCFPGGRGCHSSQLFVCHALLKWGKLATQSYNLQSFCLGQSLYCTPVYSCTQCVFPCLDTFPQPLRSCMEVKQSKQVVETDAPLQPLAPPGPPLEWIRAWELATGKQFTFQSPPTPRWPSLEAQKNPNANLTTIWCGPLADRG